MATKALPSTEVLRQLLWYEPQTGKLYWKERSVASFVSGSGRYTAERAAKIWNSKYAGRAALNSVDPGLGYRKGSVGGRKVYAHRVIWAMQTGQWPAGEVDHINGDRADNRLQNLRDVPRRINAKNARCRATNTSGMMGVWQIRQTGKWRSSITIDGRTRHLGCFPSFAEASRARREAELTHGFHANHGRQ